jgi:hypothetical protein
MEGSSSIGSNRGLTGIYGQLLPAIHSPCPVRLGMWDDERVRSLEITVSYDALLLQMIVNAD